MLVAVSETCVYVDQNAVHQSIVMRDRETGRSRGFGFVTYGSEAEASNAIASLNEQELDGRRIKVNVANARTAGGGGGGGERSRIDATTSAYSFASIGYGGGYGGGGGGGYGGGYGASGQFNLF